MIAAVARRLRLRLEKGRAVMCDKIHTVSVRIE